VPSDVGGSVAAVAVMPSFKSLPPPPYNVLPNKAFNYEGGGSSFRFLKKCCGYILAIIRLMLYGVLHYVVFAVDAMEIIWPACIQRGHEFVVF